LVAVYRDSCLSYLSSMVIDHRLIAAQSPAYRVCRVCRVFIKFIEFVEYLLLVCLHPFLAAFNFRSDSLPVGYSTVTEAYRSPLGLSQLTLFNSG
jgi:hypothetical protein